MKQILVLIVFCLGFNLSSTEAQVVKDPLLDYYQRISNTGFYPQNSDPNFHYSPQTRVTCFEANFTGSERKSVFITDAGEYLGAHAKYAWSIYCPVKSGGYHLVTNDNGDFIPAGPDGPAYVGYIDQLKCYGLIIGEKYEVDAYYLDSGGALQSTTIDGAREHANAEHYPKYFSDTLVYRPITTYTFAQLAQKYAKPDPNNVITPAGK